MLRRSLIAAVALSVTLVSGCADTPRIPPADPTPTSAPLFSSDEEALAAATAVYEEYLLTSALILQEGGNGEERLRPLVSDEVWEIERQGFDQAREQGIRLVGQNEVVAAEVQQWFQVDGGTEVVTYFCVSNAQADVVDSEGQSLSDPNRRSQLTFEVSTFHGETERRVERNDPWDGGSVCN